MVATQQQGATISGHQRWRIAKDLGLSHVPVEVLDVDEREAEYLLIAENVERRGEAESDPMKKARIAKFLKEYWEINKGNSQMRQNGTLKTVDDIGETIGENRRNTQRLLKLNDLIPEIQSLVSAGKLGTTAAEQIAYLTPDEQKALLNALGESLTQKTVAEMTKLRRAIEEERKKREEVERSVQERIQQALKRGVMERGVIGERGKGRETGDAARNKRTFCPLDRDGMRPSQSLKRRKLEREMEQTAPFWRGYTR